MDQKLLDIYNACYKIFKFQIKCYFELKYFESVSWSTQKY